MEIIDALPHRSRLSFIAFIAAVHATYLTGMPEGEYAAIPMLFWFWYLGWSCSVLGRRIWITPNPQGRLLIVIALLPLLAHGIIHRVDPRDASGASGIALGLLYFSVVLLPCGVAVSFGHALREVNRRKTLSV